MHIFQILCGVFESSDLTSERERDNCKLCKPQNNWNLMKLRALDFLKDNFTHRIDLALHSISRQCSRLPSDVSIRPGWPKKYVTLPLHHNNERNVFVHLSVTSTEREHGRKREVGSQTRNDERVDITDSLAPAWPPKQKTIRRKWTDTHLNHQKLLSLTVACKRNRCWNWACIARGNTASTSASRERERSVWQCQIGHADLVQPCAQLKIALRKQSTEIKTQTMIPAERSSTSSATKHFRSFDNRSSLCCYCRQSLHEFVSKRCLREKNCSAGSARIHSVSWSSSGQYSSLYVSAVFFYPRRWRCAG